MNPEDAAFGYMSYDPHGNMWPDPNSPRIPYPINPMDIQIFYRKLFDLYCGSFMEKKGEFLTLLRLYQGDYRRTVVSIETKHLTKEVEEMTNLFGARIEG